MNSTPITPFSWVTESARPRLLASLTVLLVGASIWLAFMGRDLVTTEAPHGIVSFELARTVTASEAMLRSWSPRARSAAMAVQGFDFLYLVLYPAWFSLVALGLGSSLGGAWRSVGIGTSWIVLGAAPLDAVENHALIQQLLDGATAFHAGLAWGCAVPKFALLAWTALFLVLAGGVWLGRRRAE